MKSFTAIIALSAVLEASAASSNAKRFRTRELYKSEVEGRREEMKQQEKYDPYLGLPERQATHRELQGSMSMSMSMPTGDVGTLDTGAG